MDKRVNNLDQIAYVRRYTMANGNEAGLKIVEVNNGKLRFLLNESKALDLPQLWHNGMNVSFLSKGGLSARETPFLSRFEGGMLYTCGLESVGVREGCEMHGTLHNTPAKISRAECTEEGITVVAQMSATELFGKNLVLTRKVFTAIGSDSVTIEDTLENRAYRDEEYCLLYHVNLGYPMLDDGARVEGAVKSVIPRTAWAKQFEGEREHIKFPVDNEFETCYFMEMKEPRLSLVNDKLAKRFTLGWSQSSLKKCLQWKSMASGDYALGFEPCTTLLDDRFEMSRLAAGATERFTLTMTVEDI